MSKKFLQTFLACSLVVGLSNVIFSTECHSYGIDDEIDSSYKPIIAKFNQTQLNELKSRTIKQATWQIKMTMTKVDHAGEEKLNTWIGKYIDQGRPFGELSIQTSPNPQLMANWLQIIKSSYTETVLNIKGNW